MPQPNPAQRAAALTESVIGVVRSPRHEPTSGAERQSARNRRVGRIRPDPRGRRGGARARRLGADRDRGALHVPGRQAAGRDRRRIRDHGVRGGAAGGPAGAEGLAERRPGPDGRRVSVRLTAKGDRRAKAILAPARARARGRARRSCPRPSSASSPACTRSCSPTCPTACRAPGASAATATCTPAATTTAAARSRAGSTSAACGPSRRRPSARATGASARTASSPGAAADLAEGVAAAQEVDLRAVGMADDARSVAGRGGDVAGHREAVVAAGGASTAR